MSVHKQSIRAILFYGGSTKKDRAKKKRELAKNNVLPSLNDIRRSRSKKRTTRKARQTNLLNLLGRKRKEA